MNKHIELVKKWLEDKDSVSLEELEANSNAAAKAVSYYTAATNAAINAANYADDAAYWVKKDDAAYWVKRYEELIKNADAAAAYWVKRYEELTK